MGQKHVGQASTHPPTAATAELLKHPDLWRAEQLFNAVPEPAAPTTGFSSLDAHLPGNGWPQAGLGEFLLNTLGVGELRLLAPLLARLSREQTRWITWINPPFVPYAPALKALGIDVEKMLLIHPKNHKDALWALEQASKSGTCSVALAWLDESKLTLKDTRRLQLAAKHGQSFVCLFRPLQAAQQNSMAELRLQITAPEPGELEVCINKRRRGWPVQGLRVSLSDELKPEAISEQLSLWRSFRQRLQEPQTSPAPQQTAVADFQRSRRHRTGSSVTH